MSGKTIEAILSHMNKDHKTSLYDYLAVYAGVKLDLDDHRKSVELVDVRLDKLTLNYNDSGVLKSAIVPLSPPMKSFSDSRNRLISMAFEAADALGVSPYRVASFVKPSLQRGLFGIVLGLLFAGITGITFSPTLAANTVGLGTRLHRATKLVFYATVVIHVVEMFFELRPLLRYYRVPTRTKALYYLLTLLVGFPAWVPLKKKTEELLQHRREFEKRL